MDDFLINSSATVYYYVFDIFYLETCYYLNAWGSDKLAGIS